MNGKMKAVIYLAVAIVATTVGLRVADASGPISVYALVSKVDLEPNAEKPDRIRIIGVFVAATDDRGTDYSAPQAGYLYFALPADNWDLALREWSDLKSVAGTRQVVGLGSIWSRKVRVRAAGDKAADPDAYPMGNGIVKVNADHPRAQALLDFKER